MPDNWPIPQKILQIKRDMTYRELSEAVYQKTGKKIHYTAFSKLATGKTKGGRLETIAALAEYAGVPISWFYEPDSLDPVAEALERYLSPTGNAHIDDWRRELLGFLNRQKGKPITMEEIKSYIKALDALMEIAPQVVQADEQSKKK